MGAMFRSEEMTLCQMFIQQEAAYQSVSELGEIGAVQFRDLNPDVNAFQRKFVSEVRRCDEMERKLRYIEIELNKDNIPIIELGDNIPKALNPKEIINLEAQLEKTETEIYELSENEVNLRYNYQELIELRTVLERAREFFTDEEEQRLDTSNLIPSEGVQQQARGELGYVVGVIQRERVPGFERMLWRISRGNVFLRRVELQDPFKHPSSGILFYKTVFIAFFQGEQLKNRIKKVCAGFHASLYPCPNSVTEQIDMLRGLRTRLEDLRMVLHQTEDHRRRVLVSVARDIMNWTVMVRKMKAIYHTMNLFNMDVTKKCLIGECWVPVNDLPVVQKALTDGSLAAPLKSFLNVIDTHETPPTFNRTNRFTSGFQTLIDSYGIASYRECNPALYTIITFPFLFGVMFGDLGHGIILALFGGWMVGWEKKLGAKKSNNEIWNIFFGGRYIIFLMGLFSMYTGFVYNDLFSKSMNIFGSSWRINYNETFVESNKELTLDPADSEQLHDRIYIIGMDPVWQLAKNKIIFINSYKMRLSIIFGVSHMIFGVCMSVVNHMHFKKAINILLEFLPQIIFLVLLFGYMVALMFLKWIMYSAKSPDFPMTPGCAPSVLIIFINMMLFKEVDPKPHCEHYLMFSGQNAMQMTFVVIALICIPWMLLGKPIYILLKRRTITYVPVPHNNEVHPVTENVQNQPPENEQSDEPIPSTADKGVISHRYDEGTVDEFGPSTAEEGASSHRYGEGTVDELGPTTAEDAGMHGDEDEPFSEICIHQAIHTIEYVLSTVSHTASYLRLWALSLAHGQLSEVLWSRLLSSLSLQVSGYFGAVMLFVVFAAWAMFTIAILVMMEGLSAFLHTLRLHWVEFMSKFYDGTGYAFHPFTFKNILYTDDTNE